MRIGRIATTVRSGDALAIELLIRITQDRSIRLNDRVLKQRFFCHARIPFRFQNTRVIRPFIIDRRALASYKPDNLLNRVIRLQW